MLWNARFDARFDLDEKLVRTFIEIIFWSVYADHGDK